MANEVKTEAELLRLFKDNTNGSISAQDLRDFVVSAKVDIPKGIVNVKADTNPTLGGNLKLNGFNIGSTTPTEIGYVHGVTSAIQTQLNSKANASSLATVAHSGSYSDLSSKPTLGTAAALNVGIGDNNVVQLDGSGLLPAIDGSQLINLPSGGAVSSVAGRTGDVVLAYTDVSGLGTVAHTGAYSDLSGKPTLGTAAALNVGTTGNDVVQLSGGKLPAVDSSQLTNLPGLAAVVDDTSPKLGGDLDTNGHAITTKSNAPLILAPNGSGALQACSFGNARGINAVDLQINTGSYTVASGYDSTIGGGVSNSAQGTGDVIAGGVGNLAQGNFSVVSGGNDNAATGDFSVISGGYSNATYGYNSVIGGGWIHYIDGASDYACISSGYFNAVENGAMSFIGGGLSNAATGYAPAIAGGANNIASGSYSHISGGRNAVAGLYGSYAHANALFTTGGDAQFMRLVAVSYTDSATPANFSPDGGLSKLILPTSNTSWTFKILAVARSSAGIQASYEAAGAIKNLSGTTSLVGSPTVTDLGHDSGASSWTFGVSADNTNYALTLTATGAASTSIRWVATVYLTQVQY